MDTSTDTVVATDALYVGTSRAANRGDVVHRETADANDWTAVAEHGSPEAVEALGFNPYDAEHADDGPFDSTKAPIPDVMAKVGDDAALATTYRDAELARGAGATRPTLVDQLQTVIDGQDGPAPGPTPA